MHPTLRNPLIPFSSRIREFNHQHFMWFLLGHPIPFLQFGPFGRRGCVGLNNVVSFRSDSAGDAVFCGDEFRGGEGAVVEDGYGVAVDGF